MQSVILGDSMGSVTDREADARRASWSAAGILFLRAL